MTKKSFRERALDICQCVHAWLLFSLLIAPGVAVGGLSRLEGGSFFERYLLYPLVVAGVIVVLWLVNALLIGLLSRSIKE